MEFTKIISSPVFAASAPDIGLEAQSASPVKIEVTTSSASWSITLSPVSDASGKNLLNIRLRDILSAAVTAPDTSETEPNSAIPIPVVSLSASNDDGEQASMDIPVAYGSLNGKDPADFIGHWLTSREQICRTYSWARERLSLIFGPQLLRLPGPVSLSINCRAYFASGTARNFHLVSATSENTVYYSIDCSYSAISALDDSGEQLVAWDLSYTLSGLHADGERAAVESFPQRFILANQDERIREYIFANCFGMEDRVFGEGIAKREVSGSSSTFINGGKTLEVSNNAEIVYTAFSGQLSDRRAVFHWYDFLSSDNRKLFDARDSSMTRIVVDGHDSKTDDFNVSGVNFSYRLSEKRTGYPGNLFGSIGDYDPKQQFGALWVDDDPQAITPEEEDLFFLKHRLSEFQTLTASDALLLLVQTPATDAWGSISLGSIKSWIKKFLDGESRAIRLNSLADYETADGNAINPSDLPDGSIPVWNAAAGAYRPTPVSELGPSGEDLHSLIFKKGDQAVLTYTPNKSDAVFDISDFASGKTVSDHISNESVHVTTEEKSLWNSLSALFELVNIGTEENPVPAIRAKYGLFSDSFISVRGSDPEAGGSTGQGIDEEAMWTILGTSGTEKIDATHIPALPISQITGLQSALATKLESITKPMVEAVLTGTITSHNHDGRYAPLSGGLIPSQYLPSYVDDVLEYASMTAFPATGEAGKIYVALDTNLTYRWGGSAYVEISPSLALGYTSSTAYPGDEGAALAALVEGMKEITDLFGIDEGGNVYVKGGKGFYGTSFLSARGSDPESGSSGSGLDEDAMWDALAAGTSEQINVTHIPALNISKITGLQSALDGKLNNGSTTYDTAYARNLTINGITYGIWATANPAALGPFYIPTSAGTSGYILQSTGGVPGWISRAALTQQLFSGGKGCVAIPENSDLNDYTTPGLYYCPANATVRTLANVPVTDAFSLEILQAAGVIQILREYGYSSNANEYTRRYYNGSWTTWVRAPRLNELYTKTEADGRYLKLAGGTMTGNLTARNIILPNGYVLYSVEGESGGGMLRFENGRTILGSIGASTTAATHIRSITGHITTGSSDAATYNVLDTGNYTSYTVTKTGGGASGTWGINISGNAGRAAYLTSTYTGSGGLQPPSYFNGMGLKVNMMNKPVVYSDVVVVNGYNGIGSDVPYINAIGFQKTSGDHGEVYHARGDYGGDSWGTWHKFLDEYNYTSYAVSLTGAQTISGAKTFSSPVTAPALTYSRKYITRCNSVGWYRCFSFSLNNASCPTVILHISRIYNTSDGESYVFAISLGYDGKVSITQLSGMAGQRIITKIRVAYVNLSTAYVDFYYSLSYSRGNEVYVSSSGYGISQTPEQVNDTTSSFYEFETSDGCKSDTYVTAGQYVHSPKGLFGLTEAQANSYAGSGYYKLAVGQQSPGKGASLLLYRDSTAYQSYIGWSTGSADHAIIGLASGTNDLGLTNKKGAIKLTGQGILTYNNYTVWHAGNDGSGSGLDADKLDGTQKSGLLTSAASTPATNLSVTVGGTTKSVAGLYATYLGGFPATAFDLSTNLGTCPDYGCYVIGLMQITDYTTLGNHANGELIFIRQNGNNPAQKIIYSLSTRYNTTDVRFGHLVVGYYSNVAVPCTFTYNGKKWAGFNVTVASAYGAGIVCKRDGLRLGERSTPFLLKYRDSNTGEVLNSEVDGSLSVDGGDITNHGVSTTRFVGALEGNATSATKLATARSLWGQSFNGTGNVSGDMTGVGWINNGLRVSILGSSSDGSDTIRLLTYGHNVEFGGLGYSHKKYYLRPEYGSQGSTNAALYIQNASASSSPAFTTTHAFENNGNAAHIGSLTAGSSITSGGHLFMKAATARFVFNAAGSGFMMSMESGNFRLISHNNASYVARLVEVDMSGNVGIKSTPASGYALTVAGAGYFGGALSLPLAGSVGLLVDNNLRNLSWTVDTSGGWARSLRATDPTGSTTLINAVGVYGAGQTPEYVYLGGTSYSSPSMVITAAGTVGIGTTAPNYRLDVRGTGYFSGVLGANGMTLPYGGTSWISMASTPAVLQGRMNQSASSAHSLFRVKNSAGDAIVFGGLGSNTGFYGFTAERISSGANSYDWFTTWNVGTGLLKHNGAMTVGGLLTASAGLTTPQYVQVGGARLKWDAAANALYVEKSDGTACGFYSKGFVSARGSDPEAGETGGGGLDEEALWDILGTSGTEKIDESHLPTATASTPGIVKGGYAYKVPGSQTSVNLPVTITASGEMYVSVPASAIKTILMNLG